jgi:YegS/Rv2252/BmrU family lipid kinase
VALIANPASGRGRGAAALAESASRLRERSVAVETLLTRSPGHAVELARGLPDDVGLVLVIGGDGTTRDVAEGLAGREVAIGILPAGTGNDLIRTLGIPRSLEAALDVALAGAERRLDVWSWNDAPFVNVAGIGLDAAVAGAVNRRFRRLGGTAAYVLAFAGEFLRFRPLRLRLTWPEGSWEGGAWLAAFGNAAYYGGGMRIVPDAVPDDGLLDVVVVEDVSRAVLLQQFPRLFSGAHVTHPRVRRIRASEINLELLEAKPPFAAATIDGELIASAPAAIRRLPHALRVRVPR